MHPTFSLELIKIRKIQINLKTFECIVNILQCYSCLTVCFLIMIKLLNVDQIMHPVNKHLINYLLIINMLI